MALELKDVPKSLRVLMGYIVVEEDHDKWLQNGKSFDGVAPLQLLGIKSSRIRKAVVEEIVERFYTVLGFVSCPGLPTAEEMTAKILAELPT
jgi:hypothetical protein